MICAVSPYSMVSYGGLKGEEGQPTFKQKDPGGPEDEKVVPLFGKRPREELVPIHAPEERIGADGRATSAWGERGTGDLIDPSAIPSVRPSRRALRVAFSGAAGAVVAAAAVALGSGDLFSRSAPVLRAIAGESRTSASVWTHPRPVVVPQLHRSGSQMPHAHPKRQAKRSGTARHHVVTKASPELVSYQRSSATSSGSTSGTESSSDQTPPPIVPSSSHQSTPATTASASNASGSRPTQPSPSGVLTCISNCG
jgi:hypothetical protein